MPFLPVDTAVVVEVGPLIDDTDFKSLEEAIAYNETNMDVDLLKKSATSLVKVDLTLTSGGTSDWTHKGSGVYEVEITAGQNDTEGSLRLVGLCDGVLPFESPVYTVVPQAVYNALVAGSDKLEVDVNQVGGTAVPETDGKLHVLDDAGDTVANESKQDTMDTVVDAVKAKTDNLPVDPADASVIAGLLATIAAYIDTEVGAIKDKTDNIPASPAPASEYDTEMARITANVATEAKQNTIDTVVDAVKAKTDNLPGSPAAVGSEMKLEDNAITAAKHDESTSFPIKSTDSGASEIARTGADGDTLEDLSDEIEEVEGGGGGGGDATVANQTTIMTHLTDLKGTDFVKATHSNKAILDTGNADWVTGVGSGTGSRPWVYTTYIAGVGEPDVFVYVTATNDPDDVVVGSGTSDSNGEITFNLTLGNTYYLWASKSGKNFPNPDIEVID